MNETVRTTKKQETNKPGLTIKTALKVKIVSIWITLYTTYLNFLYITIGHTVVVNTIVEMNQF